MKNGITFDEAFKEQLLRVQPLTEEAITVGHQLVCELSGEVLRPGDVLLKVAVPEMVEEDSVYTQVKRAKKEIIENKGWKYFPDSIEGIPIASPESVLGVKVGVQTE